MSGLATKGQVYSAKAYDYASDQSLIGVDFICADCDLNIVTEEDLILSDLAIDKDEDDLISLTGCFCPS